MKETSSKALIKIKYEHQGHFEATHLIIEMH